MTGDKFNMSRLFQPVGDGHPAVAFLGREKHDNWIWIMSGKMLFMMCIVMMVLLFVCSCAQKPGFSANVFNIREPLRELCYIRYTDNENYLTETERWTFSTVWFIDIKNSVITHEQVVISDTGKDWSDKHVLDEKETARIISICNACDFSKWKTEYGRPRIDDEWWWSMTIRYMDGSGRKIVGTVWPADLYDDLYKICSSLQKGLFLR